MKKAMFKKVANSFAGRMLRRLMGEEKGSVMIEYILVALLIVVAGVVIFSALSGVLGASGDAVVAATIGDDARAEEKIAAAQEYGEQKQNAGVTKVKKLNKNNSDSAW